MCFLLPSAACVQVWLALEPKVGALAALPGLTISQRPRILRLALGVVAVPVRGEVAVAGGGRGGRGGGGTLLPVRCGGGGVGGITPDAHGDGHGPQHQGWSSP